MYPITIRPAASAASPPESVGATFCRAAAIDDGLAERLLLDGAGHPFAPVVIAVSDDPAALAAQLDLLLRPEPVGGAEALLKANGERIGDAALARLHRRLAAGGDHAPITAFFDSLRPELARLDRLFEARVEEIGRELRACQTTLRAWQEATSHESGLIHNALSWIFGGAGRLALPQAVAICNQRERLSLSHQAWSAARAVVGRLADEIDTLRESQDALLRSAELALRAAQDRRAARRAGAEGYTPWTWQGSPTIIAERLVGRVASERLVAELIARISADSDVAQLAAHARALADAEAAALVAGITIADAIVSEAGDTCIDGIDPLVLVGQQLLRELEQGASWRLQRSARPRVEVVQVTGDGTPLFHLDGLGTAAAGAGGDRLGFVRLESGVASDDLRVLQEGAESFAQALALRNFYVIEELAQEVPPPAPVAPNVAITPTHNGLLETPWRTSDG